jgi:hypothetical protein
MSEVNHNAGGFDSESTLPKGDRSVEQHNQSPINADKLKGESDRVPEVTNPATLQAKKSVQKMNWQKLAHKLREHNRKLYKQVFRLEQDLAEITNKYNKYVEKCKSNDLLMAHQAEEIKSDRESIALCSQQLANERQEADNKEIVIEQLSQKYELSQKQTAQLERECTLLQEKYNNQAYELANKEKENQKLKSELERHQQIILEYETRQKRESEAKTSNKTNSHKNYPHNRYIQPWSISSFPESKISLPKTKLQPLKAKHAETKAAIKIAPEIATHSKLANKNQTDKSNTANSAKSSSKKPQSLAAVELPTFPRPK